MTQADRMDIAAYLDEVRAGFESSAATDPEIKSRRVITARWADAR